MGYSPWGHNESDMTEHTHTRTQPLLSVSSRNNSYFHSYAQIPNCPRLTQHQGPRQATAVKDYGPHLQAD